MHVQVLYFIFGSIAHMDHQFRIALIYKLSPMLLGVVFVVAVVAVAVAAHYHRTTCHYFMNQTKPIKNNSIRFDPIRFDLFRFVSFGWYMWLIYKLYKLFV